MRSCTEYKASRRPLIDSVRSELQAVLERAAEVDIKKTVHLELSHEDSVSGAEKLFNMIKEGDDDTKTTSQSDHHLDSTGSRGGNSNSS